MLEQQIQLIADGKKSVSRITRILKALGHKADHAWVAHYCKTHGIPIPAGIRGDAYPDIWSFLLEARTFWVRVRRYWGDKKAQYLHQQIQDLKIFKKLYPQFGSYTTSSIYERRDLDLNFKKALPAEIKAFDLSKIQQKYIEAFEIEFRLNPNYNPGAKFPLWVDEYEQIKKEKYRDDCIETASIKFPNESSVIDFFDNFWGEIQKHRSPFFCSQLERLIFDRSKGIYPKVPYYRTNEQNFRKFLGGIPGLANNYPFYLTRQNPIRMDLEGLLYIYGWEKVNGFLLWGILQHNNKSD